MRIAGPNQRTRRLSGGEGRVKRGRLRSKVRPPPYPEGRPRSLPRGQLYSRPCRYSMEVSLAVGVRTRNASPRT